jgi:uncharacterized protein
MFSMFKMALMAVCVAPALTLAASFDCKKAHSPIERSVCADPKLSTLDSSISAAYGIAMQQLSPTGQALLRSGQRQWLTFVREVCSTAVEGDEADACLQTTYQERLSDLASLATTKGPYLFSRSEIYSAKNHDESGRPYQIHISTPRIDGPSTPNTQHWNSLMASQAERAAESGCDATYGDEFFDADFIYASARVISLRSTHWEYCHGAPHGYGGTTSFTYVTQPTLRPLEALDLFVQGSGWEDFLTRRSYEALIKKAEGTEVDEKQVGDIALDLYRWTLTKNGLLITFDPYMVLSYAQGATEVVIPWSDLAPFMLENAPTPK